MEGFPPPPESRPTLDNWDMPPFNRWSFQNVRALIPTVEVSRGVGAIRELPYAIDNLSDIAFTALDGEERTVAQLLAQSYTDGFLVLHRGRVVMEHYDNGMSAATAHLSQSVAKSIVGSLAGIIIGRGLIDPQKPLADYVPELAVCGYGDANLSHVLNMTSGVHFDENYGVEGSDITRIDYASGWRPTPADVTRETIYDVILTLQKAREHGEIFQYRSIETDVIGWVLQRVTDTGLAELVSREIWQKIGAEKDASFTVDTAGTPLADGGFNATLRDYARFGLMMANGGQVEDQQVVPADWVAASGTGDANLFGEPYTGVSPKGAYSNQWWVHNVDHGDYMARGVFGQLIYIDPSSQLVAVKLSSWPDYLVPSFTIDALRAIIAIRNELSQEAG